MMSKLPDFSKLSLNLNASTDLGDWQNAAKAAQDNDDAATLRHAMHPVLLTAWVHDQKITIAQG